MTYAERKELARVLHRYVNNAPSTEYDSDMKPYLRGLIDKFTMFGYSALVHPNDKFQQDSFDELLRKVLA